MRLRLQIALLVAAALYMGWGLALLLAPQATQSLISAYPNDPVMSRLFGSSLIAWTVAFCIGARHPEREIVQAAIVAMLVISLAVSYSTFLAAAMPRTAPMVISLALNSALALFLLVTRMGIVYQDWRAGQTPASRPRPVREKPARAPRPNPVRETPAPSPRPKSVRETPAPSPRPNPVRETPAPSPVKAPEKSTKKRAATAPAPEPARAAKKTKKKRVATARGKSTANSASNPKD